MPASLPTIPGRAAPRFLAPLLALTFLPTAAAGGEPDNPSPSAGDPPRLAVASRSVALERGEWATWQVDYLLRNDGPGTLVVPPAELVARVDGSVSNSRVPDHE